MKYLVTLVCVGLSVGALANEVTLNNLSNTPMHIVFQYAHKNKIGSTHLSAAVHETLNGKKTFSVLLNGYDYAGVIIDSVDGHSIPISARKFAVRSCAVITSQTKTSGQVSFDRKTVPNKITCSKTA